MFRHYLKVALRNLSRDMGYVLINILGLSLAVACCLILVLHIRSELTHDQHNEHFERIYRVVNEVTTNGIANRVALTSQALGPLFTRQYPDSGEFVRFRNLVIPRTVFRHEDVEFTWDDVRFADENVFDVFTHKPVYGELDGALSDPSSIAISETFAKTYFGDDNPVGETISTDTFNYRVTAVFEDLPENSHLKYSALLSMNRLGVFGISDDNLSPQELFSVTCYTYFKLHPGISRSVLERQLTEFQDRNTTDIGQRLNSTLRYIVQPLESVHFESGFAYDAPTGNIFYVYGFMAVSIFVILVACINYTNLATARATRRGKEIGVRKVVGASKSQLIGQFLGESVVYALVAMLIGIVLVRVLEVTTPLNELLGMRVFFDLSREPALLAWIAAGAVGVGLLAGIYPAFYLSSIPILSALAVNRGSGRSGLTLRNILVFFQLFVSIGVTACTLLMSLQMRYIDEKPLGFNPDNRLAILLRGVDVLERLEVIKTELLKHPDIVGVSETSFIPGDEVALNLINVENNEGQMEPAIINQIFIGDDYIKVMNIEVVEGRDFSVRLLTDIGTSVVVNQALVRRMGWTDPIGKRIGGGDSRVVGVVRDFHFDSLHQPVGPAVMRPIPILQLTSATGFERNLVGLQIVVHLSGRSTFDTIEHIRAAIADVNPSHLFEYRFFDDLLAEIYKSEMDLIRLTGIFALICIFISCLGLFGLSAFATAQRTKEIGIRKVLGASTSQIILLFSKTLMYPVLLAAVLASLVSFIVMRAWLGGFAYHTDLEPWVFVVSSAVVALLGFATVALQSAKTARSNPAVTLRYE